MMKEGRKEANVFDYLAWRGDVPFSVSPFNEVDNLILAELAYTDFYGVIPGDGEEIPLAEACGRFFRLHNREEILASKSYTARAPLLMPEMLGGIRFGEMKVCCFAEEKSPQADTQFAAMTFRLADGSSYIAFRGTDGTLVGWKEDFNFSYKSGTGSQIRAAEYLDRTGIAGSGLLRVGGHSKGGNLAVYAAAFCGKAVRNRIAEIWNNDGPGFRPDVLESDGYREVAPRIISVIPETSVIGMLLENRTEPRVVQSSASGMVQHDALSWQVTRDRFVPAQLSETSVLVGKTMNDWLARTDDESRKAFSDMVFSALGSTGSERFSEMSEQKWKTLEAILNSVKDMPKEKQQEMRKILLQLSQSGAQTVTDYAKSFTAGKLQAVSDFLSSLTGGGGKDKGN